EQNASHRDAHLPAAGEFADVAVDPIIIEAKTEQNLTRLAFERIAAEMVVFFLHFSEPLENLVHFVEAFGVGHRLLKRFEFMMQVADASASGNGFVEHRSSGHFFNVLAEVAYGEPLRYRNFSLIGRFFADNHSEKRGLTGAVGSDQTHLFARIQL